MSLHSFSRSQSQVEKISNYQLWFLRAQERLSIKVSNVTETNDDRAPKRVQFIEDVFFLRLRARFLFFSCKLEKSKEKKQWKIVNKTRPLLPCFLSPVKLARRFVVEIFLASSHGSCNQFHPSRVNCLSFVCRLFLSSSTPSTHESNQVWRKKIPGTRKVRISAPETLHNLLFFFWRGRNVEWRCGDETTRGRR